jgi:DNA repair protein RadA/Sms
VPLHSGPGQPLACFGELGLTGELRTVAHSDRRLAEAAKFRLGAVAEPARFRTLREAVRSALAREPIALAQ